MSLLHWPHSRTHQGTTQSCSNVSSHSTTSQRKPFPPSLLLLGARTINANFIILTVNRHTGEKSGQIGCVQSNCHLALIIAAGCRLASQRAGYNAAACLIADPSACPLFCTAGQVQQCDLTSPYAPQPQTSGDWWACNCAHMCPPATPSLHPYCSQQKVKEEFQMFWWFTVHTAGVALTALW